MALACTDVTERIRLGVIGLGNMGAAHCKLLQTIPDLKLVAGCDVDPNRVQRIVDRYGCAGFADAHDLIAAEVCDAILIATPHFSHTTIGIDALRAGYHVLVEKPISVHKADALRLIRAYRRKDRVFAAMFNQRTDPAYVVIRQMIRSGSLGAVRRFQWTITDWFRSQAYYDSGGWRATWAGEGGGVLLNQCPHQLDLLQWLFGMPASVTAFCRFGRHHSIEVEDEVTAYLDYASGAAAVFTTTTGEAPGINRLEIAAEHGLLTYDSADSFIRIQRNDKPVSRAIAENASFEKPATAEERIEVTGSGGQHKAVLENFAAAIVRGEALIAPAAEGIHSVELANAMLLSAWRGKPVHLPVSARTYTRQLQQRIQRSSLPKTVREVLVDDMSGTF
jgi:predicted dehydrogenase